MHSLEVLESRIAPALMTPSVVRGVLMLQHDGASGTGESLAVTQTGVDTFTVVDTFPTPDTNFGAFTGVKSISVQFGSDNSQLDLKTSTLGLTGALNISATGGGNFYMLRTVDGVSGRIGGKVTIEGGSGSDQLEVEDGLAIASPVVFDGHDGSDSFYPDDAYLAKLLTLESVENITTQGLEPVVIGGLLVENEDANAPVVFVLNNVATIVGKLTYCGSETVVDNVTLNGQVTGPALLMLFGGENNVNTAGTFASSLKITGAGGDDTVVFESVQTNFGMGTEDFANAYVAGPLTMKLGDGTNTVTFDGASTFAKGFDLTTGTGADTVNFLKFNAMKNVTLSLGNGANTINGTTEFGESGYIGGLFKYAGGADADTLDLDQLIAGTINVNLGNGANAVTGSGRITGKTAVFLGGAGVETLNFSLSSVAATLTVKLGDGADTFTFGGGTLGKAVLDGGPGADTLNGVALLPAVRTIKNFETQT